MAKKKVAKKKAVKKPAKKAAKKPAKKAAAKKPAKKKAAKKAAKKPAKKAKAKRKVKPNPKFMAPMKVSSTLAAVVGDKPLPRTEVVKKIWAYIKKNKLQDTQNRRMINTDAKLKSLFGKDQINMFEMMKLVNKHLS